jgi:hypothetical protein
MSSSATAPSPAQIGDLRETPLVIQSGRLDTSAVAAFESPATTLFTQPNPRFLFDGHNVPFAGSMSGRTIFKPVKHAAVCGRIMTFPILPMVPGGIEILGFSRLLNLNIDPDQGSAPHGGRS